MASRVHRDGRRREPCGPADGQGRARRARGEPGDDRAFGDAVRDDATRAVPGEGQAPPAAGLLRRSTHRGTRSIVDDGCGLRRSGAKSSPRSGPTCRARSAGTVHASRSRASPASASHDWSTRFSAAAGTTRVVRVTCEPFAADRPYFVARLVLRTALGIGLEATAVAGGRSAARPGCTSTPRSGSAFAPLLAAAIDAEVPARKRSTTSVPTIGSACSATPRRRCFSASFTEPLLLVVEDAMWMDEASALVLARAFHGIEHRPWFVCLTTRDRSQGLSARLGFEARVLELAPLDGRLAEHLGSAVTDDAEIGQDELQELCARARGNPLFLLELAHARRELGSLDAIPEALEDLVAARIDRLAPTDRTLLRHAAVLGDRFSPALFRQTLGDVDARRRWHRLVDFVVARSGRLPLQPRPRAASGLRGPALRSTPRPAPSRRSRAGAPGRARRRSARSAGAALRRFRRPRAGVAVQPLAGQRASDNYATVEATAFFDRAIDNARAGGAQVAADELHRPTRRWPTSPCWPGATTSLVRVFVGRAGCVTTMPDHWRGCVGRRARCARSSASTPLRSRGTAAGWSNLPRCPMSRRSPWSGHVSMSPAQAR